jgi:integrase
LSVRKRTWTTSKGETKEAWVVAYADQNGKRHIKTFARKKEADSFHATANVEVRQGLHTADSDSITVGRAGEHWIKTGEGNNLERTTLDEYQRHLNLHIKPHLGAVKLSRLNAPMVSDFRAKLRDGIPPTGEGVCEPLSAAMVKKVLTSLNSIVVDAQEAGFVAQNVVRSVTGRKKKRTKKEQKRKLRAGVDFPFPIEVKSMVEALTGRWRTFMMVAVSTGLRSSELRGLQWDDIDLRKGEVHICHRADKYGTIDAPKSEAGDRVIPLLPGVVKVLREWRVECPKGALGLVFPSSDGRVESHWTMVGKGLHAAQLGAGVCTIVKDSDGRVMLGPDGNLVREIKYTGLHALRHFFASWCINRKADGGMELPPKVVQERLGHSTIAMTMDTYGHLFPRNDDLQELAAAERSLFG